MKPLCVVCDARGCEFCPDVTLMVRRDLIELGRGIVERGVDRRRAERRGMHVAIGEALDDELEARRQERLDGLSSLPAPTWDEAGNVELRVLAALAGVALVVLAVVLVWQYLVAGAVLVAAVRHLTRHTRRRRPRSSWSSLGRTAALMFAAWNTRWLKTTVAGPTGKPLRVSVPAKAGRDHVDEYGEIPF